MLLQPFEQKGLNCESISTIFLQLGQVRLTLLFIDRKIKFQLCLKVFKTAIVHYKIIGVRNSCFVAHLSIDYFIGKLFIILISLTNAFNLRSSWCINNQSSTKLSFSCPDWSAIDSPFGLNSPEHISYLIPDHGMHNIFKFLLITLVAKSYVS